MFTLFTTLRTGRSASNEMPATPGSVLAPARDTRTGSRPRLGARFLLILLTAGMASTAVSARDTPLPLGQKVPDFTIKDLSGKTWKLSDLRKSTPSGIVSLTFWCSFCHSCRHMEERLDGVARGLKGRVAVAALDASAGETADRVRAFADKKGLTLPILLDEKGHAADLFGVRVTTTTVVIDREGRLRYRGRFAAGTRGYAEEAVRALLDGKQVSTPETDPAG